MTKRKWLVLTLLLGAGFGGVLAYLCLVNRPGVTLANFERIENGMTQEQVEEILGSPANYRIDDKGLSTLHGLRDAIEVKEGHYGQLWTPGSEWFLVCFDREGNVTTKGFRPSSLSIWDRFRELLGL